MIFVTLGTQKEPFSRLLDYIENSNTRQKIVVQAGHTNYQSNKMEVIQFIPEQRLTELMKKADIIITHGGTGSILTAIKMGKKVIACARLKKYDEHVDDHQKELIDLFKKRGHLLELDEQTPLDQLLANIDNFHPTPYISNTANFIEHIISEIES